MCQRDDRLDDLPALRGVDLIDERAVDLERVDR
jgi:hypothetical protein